LLHHITSHEEFEKERSTSSKGKANTQHAQKWGRKKKTRGVISPIAAGESHGEHGWLLSLSSILLHASHHHGQC